MEDVLVSESSIPNDDIYCAKVDELKSGTEMFMNQLNLFVNIQIPTR